MNDLEPDRVVFILSDVRYVVKRYFRIYLLLILIVVDQGVTDIVLV